MLQRLKVSAEDPLKIGLIFVALLIAYSCLVHAVLHIVTCKGYVED